MQWKKGFFKDKCWSRFFFKTLGRKLWKAFLFLTRMSNIVSSLVSIIIPFSGLFLVSKKCIFWSSFESDFWKDRKFSGKNYLIISFKMEVSCGQPKQGFNLFWNVRFSGCSSFETWLLDIFSKLDFLGFVCAMKK